MLLGSAMLGATAAGLYPKTHRRHVGHGWRCVGDEIPRPEAAAFHDKKYRVFREMAEDQLKYREDLLAAG